MQSIYRPAPDTATCPHCQAASKLMTKLQEEYGPRGFQAIDVAINGLDEGRNSAQADQLIQAFWSQLPKWVSTQRLAEGEFPTTWDGITFATIQSAGEFRFAK